MPAHIGTFGVCPTAQADTKATPKEPISPTLYTDILNFF